MKHTARAHRRQGWSLMELMLVLILLSVFSLIATRLYMQCFDVRAKALSSDNQAVMTDAMVNLLRADSWGAVSIDQIDTRNVRLTYPDGSAIDWKVYEQDFDGQPQTCITRTVVRDGGTEPGNPKPAPDGLTFKTVGSVLYLIAGDDRVRLGSVRHLLERIGS